MPRYVLQLAPAHAGVWTYRYFTSIFLEIWHGLGSPVDQDLNLIESDPLTANRKKPKNGQTGFRSAHSHLRFGGLRVEFAPLNETSVLFSVKATYLALQKFDK